MAIENSLPLVSIVVPLYNEEVRLRALCTALLAQTYKSIEIILVDNNSTDETFALAKDLACEQIKVVQELQLQNADAARNRGLEVAVGQIIAFTDGDCCPEATWIQRAVEHFNASNADLVAGQITFTYSARPSSAEFYDSVSFLQHSSSVIERGVAFTANLFARREVIAHLGGFSVDTVWNGDFLFTRNAVHAGFVLAYCDDAVVAHPARKAEDVFKKVWRISWGKGFFGLSNNASNHPAQVKIGAVSFFLEKKPHIRHLNPAQMTRSLRAKGISPKPITLIGTFLVAWTVGVIGVAGFIFGRIAQLLNQPHKQISV